VKYHRARETPLLPVNRGVARGDRSPESPYQGRTDKAFGQFYKKMNLNEQKVPKEAILFYNSWNFWRKLMYAVTVVFFEDYFWMQSMIQLVSSLVMTYYIINFWPCARYTDNTAKLVNELTLSALLVNMVYIKSIGNNVDDFSLQDVRPMKTGIFMMCIIGGNLLFHFMNLCTNTINAARTIGKRRRQMVSKCLGPPQLNDPHASSESSSDEDLNLDDPAHPEYPFYPPCIAELTSAVVRVCPPFVDQNYDDIPWSDFYEKYEIHELQLDLAPDFLVLETKPEQPPIKQYSVEMLQEEP